eukprot:796674-Rhodomonas_salina.2
MGKKSVKLKTPVKVQTPVKGQQPSDVSAHTKSGKSPFRFTRAGRDPFSPEKFIRKPQSPRYVETRTSPIKLRGRVRLLNAAASNAGKFPGTPGPTRIPSLLCSLTFPFLPLFLFSTCRLLWQSTGADEAFLSAASKLEGQVSTPRREDLMLCPSNLALFRITEHMVAETTEKFNKVAVPWQKKVKTLEPSELQSAYARLCEIESMVKSQMEVLSRKEESETEKAGTSMKQDHRVVLVLCQSLLFTIPFQLQAALEGAFHNKAGQPDTINWDKIRTLSRSLSEIVGEHFSPILLPVVTPLYVPTGKFRPEHALEEVKVKIC